MIAPLIASTLPLPLLRRGKVREVYEVDSDTLLLVAGDEEQRVRVHLVDLAYLATAQQRERQSARDERRDHTVTSAAAAAGAAASIWRSTGGTTSSRNSSTCWGARPT